MQIKKATLNDNNLTLELSWETMSEAMQIVNEFTEGEYELRKVKKHRSKNANSYAWLLMGKIAEKTGTNIVDVYLHEISEVAGRTKFITISIDAIEDFKRYFLQGHIGRRVSIIQSDELYADLLLQLGSSDYDSQQMTQLINSIVEDCRQLGIETEEPENIASLLKEWK